jgi:hypothetical protein
MTKGEGKGEVIDLRLTGPALGRHLWQAANRGVVLGVALDRTDLVQKTHGPRLRGPQPWRQP